jgi:hypothetical protein
MKINDVVVLDRPLPSVRATPLRHMLSSSRAFDGAHAERLCTKRPWFCCSLQSCTKRVRCLLTRYFVPSRHIWSSALCAHSL